MERKKLIKGIAYYILALLICLPALCVVNQSGNLWINLFGLSYIVNLIALRKTKLIQDIQAYIEDMIKDEEKE